MKRKIIKSDQFLVWVFTMNNGEVKHFDPREITRGLTNYGPFTMNAISVFTKGKFATYRDGRDPYISEPGTRPARYVDADSLKGFKMEALEDGSEYHCILPRDKTARFWNRHLITNCDGIVIGEGDYVYDATNQRFFSGSQFVSLDLKSISVYLSIEENSSLS